MKDADFEKMINDPSAREANDKDLVRAFYDRVTDTYRSSWGDSFHFGIFRDNESLSDAILATEKMIADEGGFRPGMRILDIGCGVGGPALNIAAHSGAHVTGINIVERHLEIARQRAKERGLEGQVEFQIADAMEMPFADNSFDGIYIFEAGCHMPDKPEFYRQCARVLRPGGSLVGIDWLRRDGLSAAEEQRYIEPVCKLNSVPHMVTLSELAAQLTAAGLDIVLVEDAKDRGNVLRNWDLLDEKTIAGIRAMDPNTLPSALKLLTETGIALAEAARHGAFVIGHFHAKKARAN